MSELTIIFLYIWISIGASAFIQSFLSKNSLSKCSFRDFRDIEFHTCTKEPVLFVMLTLLFLLCCLLGPISWGMVIAVNFASVRQLASKEDKDLTELGMDIKYNYSDKAI
jgi:hypothetical protein